MTMPKRSTTMNVARYAAAALLATAGAYAGIAAPALSQGPKPTKPTPVALAFNRDIRPLLSDNCFRCHGPDAKTRQAGLRLDLRADALKVQGSGKRAIVPGKPEQSELVNRLFTKTAALAMPPADAHKSLTEAQKQLLVAWVRQGAVYQQHWSYEPPVRPVVPTGKKAIDWLVSQRLGKEGLRLSPAADRRTLLRRLSFDLIGLPPTAAEMDAFLADKAPGAYERQVDRLLASPHYGERMAQGWLDVVRFADTIGYHSDNPRNIYPYRDYVIRAFNTNKRFDRFTREQLAGDLLPDSNQESKVGSAFNRLLLTTEEGGAQAKDYEARYLTDRVRAVGAVWMGTTTGCAQCHDHKFDPFTTRDFYSLGAFFADIDEAIVGGREPGMLVVDDNSAKALAAVDSRIATAEAKMKQGPALLAAGRANWEDNLKAVRNVDGGWEAVAPVKASAQAGTTLAIRPDKSILAGGPNNGRNAYVLDLPVSGALRGIRIDALPDDSLPMKGPGRAGNGNFVVTEVRAQVVDASGAVSASPLILHAEASFEQTQYAGDDLRNKRWGALNAIDNDLRGAVPGWAILPEVGQRHHMVMAFSEPVAVPDGSFLRLTVEQNHSVDHNLGCFRISVAKDSAEAGWKVVRPGKVSANGGTILTVRADQSILASGPNNVQGRFAVDIPWQERLTGVRIEALPDPSLPQTGPGRAGNGNFVITEVKGQVVQADGSLGRSVRFSHASASFEQTLFAGDDIPGKRWGALHAVDSDAGLPYLGWAILPHAGKSHSLVLGLVEPLLLPRGASLRITIENSHSTDHNIGCFRIATTAAPSTLRAVTKSDLAIAALADIEPGKRTPEQTRQLDEAFLARAPEMGVLRDELAGAKAERERIEQMLPKCLITNRNKVARTVRILPRGNFLDETGPVVQAAFPGFLPKPADPKRPLNRLDLAEWLLDKRNPLTSRTVVNRIWKQFFGAGLSRVLDDLGAQGEPPTHPELLDWLAVEFRESGWDTKHLVRTIVTSETYKQTSIAPKALRTKDPDNRLLARQGRYRLDAELVRDNALFVAGLLNKAIGGPSVKPYQPDRYWENLNFPVREYVADKGEAQYRRGLYVWWQRSFLHPSLLAFDAPTREECAADRSRSNIPQQALVLLNDPSYVEASRAFAVKLLASGAAGDRERIRSAFREAIQRLPDAAEENAIIRLLQRHRADYKARPADAEKFLNVGFVPTPAEADKPELAAWTHVARVLLNLHETITRE